MRLRDICCLFYTVTVVGVYAIDVTKYHSLGSSSCTMAKYFAVFSGGFVPLCTPEGTFKEKQCYDDWCWCVDELSGEELKYTRIKLPNEPNCEYIAFAATEVDLMNIIAKEKAEEIKLVPDVFMSKPAYAFPPSSSINTQMKNYLPPFLWPEFSILITIKPDELQGGFIFAVMDSLESVVQFGVSLSPGENEYTQTIDLWYTENIQKNTNTNTSTEQSSGSMKLAKFMVPLMVDRWSRFAISLSEEKLNLFVYCHNYTMSTVFRQQEVLSFTEDSLLLIGHAGGVLQQPFKGEIQELLITNNAEDAAMQCDESFQRERQKSAEMEEMEFGLYNSFLDDEMDDEDIVSSGDTDFDMVHTIAPLKPKKAKVSWSTGTPSMESTKPAPVASSWATSAADKPHPPLEGTIYESDTDSETETGTEPLSGELVDNNQIPTRSVPGMKGVKGNVGEPGLPGKHGVNGIPGQMGEIGPRGFQGEKGEKGDAMAGTTGEKGEPGTSVEGRKGDQGEKGKRGESIIGPQGPPGINLLDELRNSELLMSRLATLTEFVGAKGEPGVCKNVAGVPGEDGANGEPGLPGVPGQLGQRGPRGDQGRPGAPGEQSEKGVKGDTGGLGIPGFNGIKGDKGDSGVQGPPGEPGQLITSDGGEIVLIPGPRGRQGLDGERGYKGHPGDKGATGQSGEPGERGYQGMPGVNGRPGLTGLQGMEGYPGLQGTTGQQGNDGQKGAKGAPGVGLPGPPGPPGPPKLSNRMPFFGTEWFDNSQDERLRETKGELGAVGAKGEKGDTGLPGEMSYDDILELIPLFATKGDKGESGIRGYNGECTNCESGKGEMGKPGLVGRQGIQGEKGANGLPGFLGKPGAPGTPGIAGKSALGPKGEPGVCLNSLCTGNGEKGEKGRDGLPGLSGLHGPPGRQGVSGEKGARGEIGPPGIVRTSDGVMVVPGPPGKQGLPGQSIQGLRGLMGAPGAPGLPGRPGPPGNGGNQVPRSYNHGYPLSDSGVLLFNSEDAMSRASLAIPIGTMGFVSDQQRLFLRVRLGWQLVQMGHMVPLLETELANVIPMWNDAPAQMPYGAPAAAPAEFTDKMDGPALRLFALNEPMSGNLGGIAGADGHCYRHAANSGIDGEYRAVLTSRLQDIGSLVFSEYRNSPVTNSKGQKILENWNSIADGKSNLHGNVPIYTFDGININSDARWSRRYLWHGGRRTGEVAVKEYCQAWTSDSSKELGATSSYIQGQLLDQSAHSCDSLLAVLCVEIYIN